MFLTIKELATQGQCSTRTITRVYREMEKNGNYPGAVRQLGCIRIDSEKFYKYLEERRRKKRRCNHF